MPSAEPPGRVRPGARARPRAEDRRRIGQAAATWLSLSLAGIGAVGALVVWHLVRRGRLIRESLPPPRVLPDLEDVLSGAQSAAKPETTDGQGQI